MTNNTLTRFVKELPYFTVAAGTYDKSLCSGPTHIDRPDTSYTQTTTVLVSAVYAYVNWVLVTPLYKFSLVTLQNLLV